jgi:hypothetical protein
MHRPISFSRRTPKARDISDRPINARTICGEGWVDKVTRNFKYRCERDAEHFPASPPRLLVLLKDSIREVSNDAVADEGNSETKNKEGLGGEDKLGITLAMVKAIESRNLARAAVIRQWDAELAALVPEEPEVAQLPHLSSSLRAHAINLARNNIAADCRELSENPPGEEGDRTRAKENIMRKITRLSPVGTGGINAMKKANGSITTTPSEIAEVLREHWGGFLVRSLWR